MLFFGLAGDEDVVTVGTAEVETTQNTNNEALENLRSIPWEGGLGAWRFLNTCTRLLVDCYPTVVTIRSGNQTRLPQRGVCDGVGVEGRKLQAVYPNS